MKTLFIVVSLLLSSIASFAQAQVNASCDIEATIVSTLTITNNELLDFGSMSVSDQPGTCYLGWASPGTSDGGVLLTPQNLGHHAEFTIHGEPFATYSISLTNTDVNLIGPALSTPMIANSFDTNASLLFTGSGTETFLVGGNLHVNGNQMSGSYIANDLLIVTVDYN